MARKRRTRKVERQVDTYDIVTAFHAAYRLYDTWDSPDGPAVVRNVECGPRGLYTITYRVIAVWGKEAW